MKIAISTDWHIDWNNAKDIIAQAEAMGHICAARGVELHLHGGDLFNRPMIGSDKASTGAMVRAAFDAFDRLNNFPYHIIIPGNHDFGGMSQADALHVFDSTRNVQVVREVGRKHYGGISIYCIPWQWSGANVDDEIEKEKADDCDILLGHVEVVGARMNGSYTCESKPGKCQVSREFIERINARHIALGHFHARQQLCARGGYIGAFIQQNFGAEGDLAGFEIYDTITGCTEWIELDAAPKHKTYIVDENNPAPKPEDIPANIKARIRYARGIDDRVAARKLEEAGAQVEEEIEIAERVKRADVKPGIIHQKHDLIRLYAESQNPPIDGDRLAAMQGAYDDIIADKSAA